MRCRLLALLVALAALPASAQEKDRIAVLDLRVDTELDPGVGKTLNEVLLNAFHEPGTLDVLGSSDIATMISLQEERVKLTGCADDACLVEIGGALGVQLLASAALGAVGDEFILSVKVIDVGNARVVDRTSETVSRDESELTDAIRRAVARVMRTVDEGFAVKGEEKPTAQTSFMDVAPWAGLGLTLALGGTAGALAGLASNDAARARDEFDGTSEWGDLKDSSKGKALAADVMFGVAGAAAVGTVVLFVLSMTRDDAPDAAASIVPVRGGAVASFGWRFE